MSETENTNTQQEAVSEAAPAQETSSAEFSQPSSANADLEEIVQSRVKELESEMKASFKQKLDEVYAQRDQIVSEKVALEEEKRQAEIKRMEDEGRHKEVAELKMAEMKAKMESLQKENTRLARDHAVTEAIRGVEFRSDVAGEMARDRILAQLVQDENGQWKHKSGVSIRDYVAHFTKDEDNAFLLKAKINSGIGSTAPAGTPDNAAKELSPLEQLRQLSGRGEELQGF